jgi:hypothetical protein
MTSGAKWLPVTFAARLAEDIKGEAEQLIAFVKRDFPPDMLRFT